LAKLPSREVLLAQLLGVMNGVTRNLVSVLAAVPRGLVTALAAIEDQKQQ
jgi:large subunit ribosomal protein L10